jgi:hypothetical protein
MVLDLTDICGASCEIQGSPRFALRPDDVFGSTAGCFRDKASLLGDDVFGGCEMGSRFVRLPACRDDAAMSVAPGHPAKNCGDSSASPLRSFARNDTIWWRFDGGGSGFCKSIYAEEGPSFVSAPISCETIS